MKRTPVRLSIGGHRSMTVLIVSLTLFVSACVFFVNVVVLTDGSDAAYQMEAEKNAQLINFNTSLLQKAKDFSAKANSTDLPAGRINPFAP